MKTNYLFPKILLTGLFLVSMTLFVSAQKPKSTLPAAVDTILTNSCAKCHGETGRAKPALDLSKWEDYTAEMKARKAKQIIGTIDNGSMPPKGFLNANPGAAVLKDQVEIIRKWSDTFTAKKAKS